MAGIYSQGGSAGHRYAGWLSEVEAKNFQFGGKVFNGSPSAIYVGSNLVWMGGWLRAPAMTAIFGAFGDDGTAVIKATNAYLNQLAASGQAGKDKATALAGFINQHPLDAALYGGLYVQDGLVFQMDRAYECTAAKWKDFIGGVEFNGSGVTLDSDNVPYFNGSAQYIKASGSNHSAATHTIEIIFKPNSIGYTHIYSEGGQGELVASYLGNGNFTGSMGSSPIKWAQPSLGTGLYAVSSAGSARAYANKVGLSAGTFGDYWSSGGTCRIGARAGGGNNFNGKIYAIRIYNRLLTEQEILANQDIDLKRFTPATP